MLDIPKRSPPNNQLQLTRVYVVARASRWVYAGSPRS